MFIEKKSTYGDNLLLILIIAIVITMQYTLSYAQVQEKWFRQYNGFYNGNDQATSIAIDKTGNIYVTGMADYDLDYTPITTVKYSSLGIQEWVVRYPDDGSGRESEGNSIATYTDNQTSITYIYITGRLNRSDPEDLVTLKYN